METLQIEKANALKAFKEANDKGKTLLTNLFGKEVFSEKITDRVKTYEDACAVLGIDTGQITLKLPTTTSAGEDKALFAHLQLMIIARALNEGWTPDWDNSNQAKYYPYFNMGAGFGFSRTDYDYWYTITGVGSRLCFKTSELAEYAGRQFESIYKNLLTL